MRRGIVLVLILLVGVCLSGCTLDSLLLPPTPTVDLPAALTALAPSPTPSGEDAAPKMEGEHAPAAESPATEPTIAPQADRLWIAPYLPDMVTDGLVAPGNLTSTSEREGANFWLDLGEAGQRHCFIEFDNQTLTLSSSGDLVKDYAAKIRTLSAFYRSGRYAEVFPDAGDSMWLLTITSGGERRRQNLMQTTQRVIGRGNRALDRYWFASIIRDSKPGSKTRKESNIRT